MHKVKSLTRTAIFLSIAIALTIFSAFFEVESEEIAKRVMASIFAGLLLWVLILKIQCEKLIVSSDKMIKEIENRSKYKPEEKVKDPNLR